jgi:hypothetical protein
MEINVYTAVGDAQGLGRKVRLAGVAHALDGTVFGAVGLPTALSGHIEFAVVGGEAGAHEAGGELERNAGHPPLDNSSDVLSEHFVKGGLSIAHVQQTPLQRPPFRAGDPHLAAGGIVD